MKTTFPVGAKVLVDGKDLAVVKDAFPEGSTSYLFPHYVVVFGSAGHTTDLRERVTVSMSRVGVTKKVRTLKCDECGEVTDKNYAPLLLGGAGVKCDGETMCEGCAEDTLEATLSNDADAREMGLDEPTDYE